MVDPVAPRFRVFPDLLSASRALAKALAERLRSLQTLSGRLGLVLPGGETPRVLFRLLSGPFREQIPWQNLHLFWGDERCVPPDHPDSNYRLATETLLPGLPIPPEQIHRIPTELGTPDTVADAYERVVRTWMAARGRPDGARRTFDVVLLGLGNDGHTASLFPGSPAVAETDRYVVGVAQSPTPPLWPRVTLTLRALAGARDAYFLVAGLEKHPVFARIRSNVASARSLSPAARVLPQERLVWFVDEATDRGLGGTSSSR
jgi:6-phosphogluconolactonase